MADLAACQEPVEGLGHFIRLDQRIRPVQQQHIQVVRFQPVQDAVDRGQDIVFGEIETLAVDNPAFGLQDDLLPPPNNESSGNLCRLDFSEYDVPPNKTDYYNAIARIINILMMLSGVEGPMPVTDPFDDFMSAERTALMDACKTSIEKVSV